MSRRRRHWQLLTAAGLMQEPPETPTTAPWYVRALQALGAWVASLFVVVSLLLMLGGMEEAALGVIGLLVLGGAFATLRSAQGDFVYQVSLALSLAGQFCISLAVGMSADITVTATVAAAVALGLIVVMADFAHRLIATLVLAGAVFVAAVDIKLDMLAVPALAVPFAVLWFLEKDWGERRSLFEPVALGLGLGLLAGALFTLRFGLPGLTVEAGLADTVRVAVVLGGLGYVLHGVLDDCELTGSQRWTALAIALVAALAIELAVANAATALLVFVAAMRAQRVALAVAAVLTLFVLVSHRYYTLQLTLLAKSLWLIGAGMVLLVLYALVRRLWFSTRSETVRSQRHRALPAGAVASVAACLLLAGFGVLRSEALLARGEVMVLALAPVDPRSLMQGDYMRLDFAVQRTVRQRLRDSSSQRGWVIMRNDVDGVARFERLTSSRPELEPGTFAFRYRWDGRKLAMLTNAFFFEEGTAGTYNAARFGSFRVNDDGEVMLVSLLDESRQALGAQY